MYEMWHIYYLMTQQESPLVLSHKRFQSEECRLEMLTRLIGFYSKSSIGKTPPWNHCRCYNTLDKLGALTYLIVQGPVSYCDTLIRPLSSNANIVGIKK